MLLSLNLVVHLQGKYMHEMSLRIVLNLLDSCATRYKVRTQTTCNALTACLLYLNGNIFVRECWTYAPIIHTVVE
jgi:hypothetical protein